MRFPGFNYLLPSSHYALLSLLFLVGLELILALHQWILALVGVLLALMAIGILLVRMEERGRFRITQAILPVLAVAGFIGFGFFLPGTNLIHVYFVTASILLFWLLKHGAKMAYPTWNWVLSTLVFFLDVAVILGIHFHLYLPMLLVLTTILLVSFLISAQAIRRITSHISEAVLVAFAMAISLTELAWTLQFLPLHYIVQAGVLVVFYYIFFHLLSVSYERKISRRDVVEYLMIGSIGLGIVLLNARWA